MDERLPQYLHRPVQILWFGSDEFVLVMSSVFVAAIVGGLIGWMLIGALLLFLPWKRSKARGFLPHLAWRWGLVKFRNYAGDPKCYLEDEGVDGVQTFRSGVATGLKPLPQTRLFGTGACTLQLTRDFFDRTRSYLCETDNSALPRPDLSRGAYIIDHSTETLLVDRTTTSVGAVQTSTRAFSLPTRGSVPTCEPICKTRARVQNTAVAPAGVVGSSQDDPAGWDTFYHACDAQNTCPMGPGEELVSACGCLDDFPEAVVMMQTVRLGGADLVCTATSR